MALLADVRLAMGASSSMLESDMVRRVGPHDSGKAAPSAATRTSTVPERLDPHSIETDSSLFAPAVDSGAPIGASCGAWQQSAWRVVFEESSSVDVRWTCACAFVCVSLCAGCPVQAGRRAASESGRKARLQPRQAGGDRTGGWAVGVGAYSQRSPARVICPAVGARPAFVRQLRCAHC